MGVEAGGFLFTLFECDFVVFYSPQPEPNRPGLLQRYLNVNEDLVSVCVLV